MRKRALAREPDKRLDLREELAAALDRFDIRSPTTFFFDGEPCGVGNPPPSPGQRGAAGDDLLVKAIQGTLYDRCYTRRSRASAGGGTPAADGDFARRLAAANKGKERWDKGWVIHLFGPNGQAFVRKGDRERVAIPGAFVFDGAPGVTAQIGAIVSLRVPIETFEAQPGYYFAFGETLDELADSLSVTRVYFHCTAENAALLVGELTSALNRFQTPFQLKAPAAPALYDRADAAVLYVASRYFPITARIVSSVREKAPLEASTPLFTKTMWPGVGVAVEPGTGESFGVHRCRLAAEGMVDAWRRSEPSAKGRLAAIEARFSATGLDLWRPWLGPNAVDPFLPPQAARLP